MNSIDFDLEISSKPTKKFNNFMKNNYAGSEKWIRAKKIGYNQHSNQTSIVMPKKRKRPINLLDDDYIDEILNDSFEDKNKQKSPESVNSMYDHRSRNFDHPINRKKMCSSVRTNFENDRGFKVASNYRTTCISKTNNYNMRQYTNVNKNTTSMNTNLRMGNTSTDQLSMVVPHNYSPHSVTGGIDYRKRPSPSYDKVSYHSHYLNNDGSPESLNIDNGKT